MVRKLVHYAPSVTLLAILRSCGGLVSPLFAELSKVREEKLIRKEIIEQIKNE